MRHIDRLPVCAVCELYHPAEDHDLVAEAAEAIRVCHEFMVRRKKQAKERTGGARTQAYEGVTGHDLLVGRGYEGKELLRLEVAALDMFRAYRDLPMKRPIPSTRKRIS